MSELEAALLLTLEEHRAEDVSGEGRGLHGYLVVILGRGFTKGTVVTFLVGLAGGRELLDVSLGYCGIQLLGLGRLFQVISGLWFGECIIKLT